MVKFLLKVQAELSNVTDLEPKNTPDSPFEYTFEIECTKCRTVHDKLIQINSFEKHEISGSRGEASFIFRCKECKNEHSINIIPTNEKLTVEDENKFINFLEIDSRGLDFLKFVPNGEFQCIGLDSGTVFNEVDLSEGEWYDVDEKTNDEVSIIDVKWEISRS
ncbi:conserved hypothetical protein [Candida tropicalis MYA-3404]|uniref:DUF866-domain-containing protein n=1 Tax=Candida tropicalis (strain ATCC MYA-3404 / T1) TaxID=294747 RepID=C5M590_CANTT|nr:conserved hypothetical protein [Candida tropicalis MYA-3404]EER35206.1 conserved hypothetical protein [Candida tropicalis MYA-3404]KAG4409098.1 hypothetical protein JTP64_002404 [Candida tropicalis]